MRSEKIYQSKREPRYSNISIRDVNYQITEWGDNKKELILYLHGWGDTGSTFQFVVDSFEKDWHVVAPDWRGFGKSSHFGMSYWFPDYLADLDVLLDKFSLEEPIHIIGHSMGANVAGLYAGIKPNRIKSFINLEGFGLTDGDPEKAPDNYLRWIEKGKCGEKFQVYESFNELVPRILKRSPNMTIDKALYVAHEWAELNNDGVVRLRADPLHKLPNATQYRRSEAEACWKRITAKTLVVVGEETKFSAVLTPFIDSDIDQFASNNSKLISIANAGHMLHFEAPDVLAKEIEKFLMM